MAVRERKLSVPLEYKELSPTKREKEHLDTDFYDKPYARCINCLKFKTRCHQCLAAVLDALKSWKDGEKIKLKQPFTTNRLTRLFQRKNDDSFNISNISLRKTHQNTEIVTFQQPVLHKNTILYCVKPYISLQPKLGVTTSTTKPKARSTQVSPLKYRRNLLVNFSYKNEGEREEYPHHNLTENDTVNKRVKQSPPRLATTLMMRKRHSSHCSANPEYS